MVDKYGCSKCGDIFSKDEIIILHFAGNDKITEILDYFCRDCYNIETAAIKTKKAKKAVA